MHIRRCPDNRGFVVSRLLERGLAEIVANLSLAADDSRALIDDEHKQIISRSSPERPTTVPLVADCR